MGNAGIHGNRDLSGFGTYKTQRRGLLPALSVGSVFIKLDTVNCIGILAEDVGGITAKLTAVH